MKIRLLFTSLRTIASENSYTLMEIGFFLQLCIIFLSVSLTRFFSCYWNANKRNLFHHLNRHSSLKFKLSNDFLMLLHRLMMLKVFNWALNRIACHGKSFIKTCDHCTSLKDYEWTPKYAGKSLNYLKIRSFLGIKRIFFNLHLSRVLSWIARKRGVRNIMLGSSYVSLLLRRNS